jgi:peptidoglycan/xylan/chitin deacetylase (PgdA/CDA1 family)
MGLKVALTVDLSGGMAELAKLCEILKGLGIRATFFASGKSDLREEDQIRLLLDRNHEIASHTLSHPADLSRMSTEEQENEIVAGHSAILELCARCTTDYKVQGFRSPNYAFDERIPQVLSRIGYV